MRPPIAALALWLVVAPVASSAMETDQYFAWGLPLADSTEAVNAKFNLELERAIASFPADRQPESCRQVAVAYRKQMRFLLMHDLQIWAWNSEWVDRIPNGADEQQEYRRTNLYSNHGFMDKGTLMPYTPTLEVAGVRFGTDKLAHFVGSGWASYGKYRKGLKKGETPEDAKRGAANKGILGESLHLGKMTSGVIAISDLEAGYAGMHFYFDLCDAEDPILKLGEDGWFISRPVDLRNYVTPRWDESFQPSIYNKGRWKKVQPILETYCDRLADPQVAAMRSSYRERDRESLVGVLVAERVAEGKLRDPAQFSIEAVCAEPNSAREMAPEIVNSMEIVSPRVDAAAARERLAAEDEDRRRFALGLPGLHISYPILVSASLAVMLTSQPESYDCRTPCDFRGPFVELEPGLGGGKLSVGWARVTGKTNRNGSLLKAAFAGAAYKATVLRTWGDRGNVEGGRTYAGLEFGLPIVQLNLGLGLLYRVDGGDDGQWMVVGGAGWGF